MNKLISFVKEFTKDEVKEINATEKIGRKYFYLTPELKQARNKIPIEPHAAGTFLGELKNNKFMPSIALLDLLCKYTSKKIIIAKKGETMFLYKKDVFEDNIIKSGVDEGYCLVLNEKNELLGYGELVKKGRQKLLLNLLDRGDFLRREEQQ
jgi:ribosome biogenesis protein Nip4